MKTFAQIRAEGGVENHHHWRLTCTECGEQSTCRCTAPKTEASGVCFHCCEDAGIDFKTGEYNPSQDHRIEALIEMGVTGLSKTAGPNDIKWQAVFMMGMSGAGKTWYRSKTYLKYMKFRLIDPDEVKTRHPDYDPDRPYIVHEWSKDVSDGEFKDVVMDGSGDPIVIDGSGRNPDGILRKMMVAKENGYRIFLVYVKVPLEVSIWRNRNRDRFVPEEKIVNVYKDYDASFSRLKGLADSYKVIPNYADSDLRDAIKDLDVYPAPQDTRPPRPGDEDYGREMAASIIAVQTKTLWHLSNSQFSRFDPSLSGMGIIWFSDNMMDLVKEGHGASLGFGKPVYLYKCQVRVNKTAGRDEYEKFGIGELKRDGYDSIELEGDWAILNSRNIRITHMQEVKRENRMTATVQKASKCRGGRWSRIESRIVGSVCRTY